MQYLNQIGPVFKNPSSPSDHSQRKPLSLWGSSWSSLSDFSDSFPEFLMPNGSISAQCLLQCPDSPFQSLHWLLPPVICILTFLISLSFLSCHYCNMACLDHPRRRQWHPTPVLLPGKSHGWRSLEGCSPWGRWGSDTTERLHFHALEKEMATHSSVLAWRIPGTGEPGGLPTEVT